MVMFTHATAEWIVGVDNAASRHCKARRSGASWCAPPVDVKVSRRSRECGGMLDGSRSIGWRRRISVLRADAGVMLFGHRRS